MEEVEIDTSIGQRQAGGIHRMQLLLRNGTMRFGYCTSLVLALHVRKVAAGAAAARQVRSTENPTLPTTKVQRTGEASSCMHQ